MTATTRTWSGLFPVHPAAEVFPMMTDAQLDELGADIKTNGLQQSIVVWRDNRDTHAHLSKAPQYVLDGRNRLAAMDRAGIPVPGNWRGYRLREPGPLAFTHLAAWAWIYSDDGAWEKRPLVDAAAFVIGANVRRRHLTKEQQADLIIKTVQAGEEFLANVARNDEAQTSQPGRRQDPVKAKAVQEGQKQGISKRTIERSLARQEGRPKTPRKPTASAADPVPVPRVDPLRAEAPPLPVETYEQQLQAKVNKATREVEQAANALKYWRRELREAEAVLRNYQTKQAEARTEAAA